ncbi:FAD/FMN-containing dehydrogenase [Prauserella shujinwangii]|uniref:FAD/FMN-containing dehydrogenase n=1 Tax=Prauserella shujinwangii TaxID=1453103 RepID=A0A2T0LR39_9PSEU|nr:FAD-dependent oxidoreductase [Prauserella shujinwangii]PRX45932.1 FAD/FMN-containing dehydrogenase [Prauserella shujinwangii]
MSIPSSTVHVLAGQVRGPVRTRGADGFADECGGFQTHLRHQPDVVVGALGAGDVCAAVRFAAERNLPVAVQATGHGTVSAADGGVLISTRRMDTVRLDPGAGTAWVAAGAPWRRVIDAAAAHGLAPLSGSAPDVGAVAYTLGGGLGPLARRYGYAADHVRSAEIVTADGRLRRVSPHAEPELFWALRGGGGAFGVVTGLEIGLVPVTTLYGGGLSFPATRSALAAYLRWTADLPDTLTSALAVVPFPDIPAVPEALRGRRIAQVRITCTDVAAGEELVAPLRAAGAPLLDTLGPVPFRDYGSIFQDPTKPHGYRGDSALLSGGDTAALGDVLDLTAAAPVPCIVDIRHLGGALARPPAEGSPVGHRSARYLLRVLSPVTGAEEFAAAGAAHARAFAAVRSYTLGRSLNFAYGQRVDPGTVFEPETHRRLAAVKSAVDPANLFRHSQNVASPC